MTEAVPDPPRRSPTLWVLLLAAALVACALGTAWLAHAWSANFGEIQTTDTWDI